MSQASRSPFRDGFAHPLAGRNLLQLVARLDGAEAEATIEIAAALTRAGANAFVAGRGGALVSELQARGGVFAPLPVGAKDPASMALNVSRLARLIKSERIDLVHVRSRAVAWPAFAAARLARIPFVTHFQSHYTAANTFMERYNSVMARGDAIIADSTLAAQAAQSVAPAAKGKVRVLPGGVDCRRFAPKSVSAARVQAIRRLWEVPADARVALIAADRRRPASLRPALDAVRRLVSDALDLANVRIVVAPTEGVTNGEFDAMLAKAGLQAIARAGDMNGDRAAALLAAAAIVAVSADADAQLGIALQAQAMGAPVIVAAGGGAAETVAIPTGGGSERTGWTAPQGDSAAIAAALREALACGASARDRLCLRARAHVESRFAVEILWAETLEAYVAALSARGRAGAAG